MLRDKHPAVAVECTVLKTSRVLRLKKAKAEKKALPKRKKKVESVTK
jgi:hypothetical protein